jgi:ABC-type lipoprotein release transport system permease subunit
MLNIVFKSLSMKKIVIFLAFMAIGLGVMAQSVSESTIAKRENRKGMVLKEWNTPAGEKRAFLDRVTTYDAMGRKIEEIEYASYGQKWRIVSEYPANSDITAKVVREIEYNDRDKVVRIRKFEYDEDGSKVRQLNYYPNGKLESVKTFEYVPK